MSRPIRIAVADDERDMRDFFERFLPRLGHEVASLAETGQELVDQCRQSPPDLIIADIKMPGLNGIEAIETICRANPVPAILVSAYDDNEWIAKAQAAGVFSYLIKPITEKDLGPAIAVARSQFEQQQALSREASDLRQALEDRKLVERAKGVVGRRVGLDEQEAFRRMRKMASDRNRKLVDIARTILTAEETFHVLDGL
jgi:response regulator NasT